MCVFKKAIICEIYIECCVWDSEVWGLRCSDLVNLIIYKSV